MHEVPALYKWVHKHHHQQTYPDRAALDTLNTGSVESQVGLYMQLGVLWSFGQLGFANLPAGIWFFTIAGYLSVLEHDKLERNLPFDIWRADDHHMHHAFVKCNYSPYSAVWDKAFGTHKPFAVRRSTQPNAVEREGGGGGGEGGGGGDEAEPTTPGKDAPDPDAALEAEVADILAAALEVSPDDLVGVPSEWPDDMPTKVYPPLAGEKGLGKRAGPFFVAAAALVFGAALMFGVEQHAI